MDRFKIEHFEKENNILFPTFYNVTGEELISLQNKLFDKFNLQNQSLLDLTKFIQTVFTIITHIHVTDTDFSLCNFLSNMNIISNASIYINWYRFDNIDKMQLIDLDKYFNDIWYPSTDDIDIFDDSFSWILYYKTRWHFKFAITLRSTSPLQKGDGGGFFIFQLLKFPIPFKKGGNRLT